MQSSFGKGLPLICSSFGLGIRQQLQRAIVKYIASILNWVKSQI